MSKDLWPFLESVYNSKLPIKGCDLKINNNNGEEVVISFILIVTEITNMQNSKFKKNMLVIIQYNLNSTKTIMSGRN